jgi:hypothetical protein
MGTNPPLTRAEVTAPTGSPDNLEAPGVPSGFAGNKQDDDALALDQYFEAAYQGPEEYQGVIPPVAELPATDRLVTARYRFTEFTPQAILAMPADPNRKNLTLIVWAPFGAGGTSTILFSGEYFSVAAANDPTVTASVLCTQAALTPQQITLDAYTGPLYVGSLLGDDCNVEIIAVTR